MGEGRRNGGHHPELRQSVNLTFFLDRLARRKIYKYRLYIHTFDIVSWHYE